MFLIVGLGNPGKQFDHTRHNAGFEALDFFAKKNHFPEFKLAKKYQALISKKNDVILAKPQTFMNESGKSLAAIVKNTNQAELIVVHDEIDLELGSLKFSKNSGAGGHKGVASIIEHLGHNQCIRLKIGVATDDKQASEVVLKKFLPQEQEILDKVIETSAQALDYLIANGIEKTMNEYNQ